MGGFRSWSTPENEIGSGGTQNAARGGEAKKFIDWHRDRNFRGSFSPLAGNEERSNLLETKGVPTVCNGDVRLGGSLRIREARTPRRSVAHAPHNVS